MRFTVNGPFIERVSDNGVIEVFTASTPRKYIGHYYRNTYGWFAIPNNSQLSCIPCESKDDALKTIIRLAVQNQE